MHNAPMGTRRTYTDQERDNAVALYLEHGPAEAERRCNIPAGTIASWASRSGATTTRTEHLTAANETKRQEWEERRSDLAIRCGEVAAKAMERVASAVEGDGSLMVEKVVRGERRVQIADPADALKLATIMAILVDKAQLLTGGATSRSEHATTASVSAKLADVKSLAAHVEGKATAA